MSFAAATLLIGSILSQSGETSLPEELQGTWVGSNYPVVVQLEGLKGKIYTTSILYAHSPVEIEITRVARGLPNSTIEFTATRLGAMTEVFADPAPKEWQAVYRIFEDEVVLLLLPKGAAIPESLDLTAAARAAGYVTRLKKIPPAQVAEFERLRGVWRVEAEPGQWFDLDKWLVTISPGIIEVLGPKGVRILRVSVDPEKRQVIVQRDGPPDDAPRTPAWGFSYDEKDRLTLAFYTNAYPLIRINPEELPKALMDPGEAALALLAGSWTAVRRWRRVNGKDVLSPKTPSETWFVAEGELTIDAEGTETQYSLETTSDPQVVRFVSDDPKVADKFGRFEVTGGVLRIRLHPTIAPEEPATPVEKKGSPLRSELYEFELKMPR